MKMCHLPTKSQYWMDRRMSEVPRRVAWCDPCRGCGHCRLGRSRSWRQWSSTCGARLRSDTRTSETCLSWTRRWCSTRRARSSLSSRTAVRNLSVRCWISKEKEGEKMLWVTKRSERSYTSSRSRSHRLRMEYKGSSRFRLGCRRLHVREVQGST